MNKSLLAKLLAIYPALTIADFLPTGTIALQNDKDGRGDYIESWAHPIYPQPSQAQIDAA